MRLLELLLTGAGLVLALRYSEGEFAGSAEDEARRVKLRRAGFALVFLGLLLRAWIEYR